MNTAVKPSMKRTSARRICEKRKSARLKTTSSPSSRVSYVSMAAKLHSSTHTSFVAPVSRWMGEGRSM